MRDQIQNHIKNIIRTQHFGGKTIVAAPIMPDALGLMSWMWIVLDEGEVANADYAMGVDAENALEAARNWCAESIDDDEDVGWFVVEIPHQRPIKAWMAKDIWELETAAVDAMGDNRGVLYGVHSYKDGKHIYVDDEDMANASEGWATMAEKKSGYVVESGLETTWVENMPRDRTLFERVDRAQEEIGHDLRAVHIVRADESSVLDALENKWVQETGAAAHIQEMAQDEGILTRTD